MTNGIDIFERQRRFARYLSNLEAQEQAHFFLIMKPSIRKKIVNMVEDAQVDKIVMWESADQNKYLDRWYLADPYRALRLKTKIAARMAVLFGAVP